MITTIFLITLAVIALVKVNKDTVKSKGTVLILLCSICLAQFFNKSFDLVMSGVILAKLAEFEPINSKYSWSVIIVSYLVCSFIDCIINSFINKR